MKESLIAKKNVIMKLLELMDDEMASKLPGKDTEKGSVKVVEISGKPMGEMPEMEEEDDYSEESPMEEDSEDIKKMIGLDNEEDQPELMKLRKRFRGE